MRYRAVLVVMVLGVVGGCAPAPPRATVASSGPPTTVALPAVPALPAPPEGRQYADPTKPYPGPPLPLPSIIPKDSYAPEPVVQIGSIEIPAIGLKHRIFQGVTLHNIDLGPSHWTGTARPGEMGNTVFAGHRATNTEPFRHIDALVPGDKVIFTVGGVRSTYRVTGNLIVRPSDGWIGAQSHAYTGTLYACHPVGSMAQRFVVRMELVP